MNPTTDSQALLTKTFLHFTPFFFFFFFCFLPCQLSLPNSNSTPLFSIPYYYVQLPVNNLYSLYLSFYFFYLYNARQQEPHSHRLTKPKTQNKKINTNSSVQTSAVQPHNTSTKSVKGKDSQAQIGKR